ncbi:MAG: MarR family transcriptional regulator [Candidatus Methanofastidiosa archaeon]|jgi:uncharacterized membrane protein|nr:MarR family transcriptional regulator [Candidatus Methanofastidiosa archaeon]
MEESRDRKTIFMEMLFVLSVFLLVLKIMNPANIQIFVEGGRTAISSLDNFFTLADVLTIAIASILLGISGTYLFLLESTNNSLGETALEERRKKWGEIEKTLTNDELKIYTVISESDGLITQSDIVTKTGLSKATTSRVLDLLESKGLLERRRRGMGNIVLLK